jgi:hypothetical protein
VAAQKKNNNDRVARDRVRAYEARQEVHTRIIGRRKRDNLIAAVAVVAVTALALGAQFAHVSLFPEVVATPTAAPTPESESQPIPDPALSENRTWTGTMQLNDVTLDVELDGAGHRQPRTIDAEAGEQAVVMRASAESWVAPEALRDVIRTCWDQDRLAHDYLGFLDIFRPLWRALDGLTEPDPETCFLVRSLLIHGYRRALLRDPMLPDELLAPDWPAIMVFTILVPFGAAALGWNGVYLAELARSSEPASIPRVTGASLFFTYGGVLVGPPAFAGLHNLVGAYTVTYALTALPALAGALILLAARRREK